MNVRCLNTVLVGLQSGKKMIGLYGPM